ncbi:MAG TPA: nodulation protein NfeD [Candidatus Binataceae bacterium]|nr:nodulation protein NfeD [Candidatus Binataceae bacterium]
MKPGNYSLAIWFVLWATIATLLPVACGQARPNPSSAGSAASSSDRWLDLIDIDGSINPAAADFIDDSIAKAQASGASALVIRLDTPGGLLSSAQKIVKAILNSPLPIIVYVAPQGAFAASAGTFVTEAANIAAMAPGTTIGAAHPLEASGSDVPPGKGAEKIENFTAAFAKTIAHQRGRNETWIEDAVRKSNSIGEREALKLHVIDFVANDLDDLLRQATGRTVTLADGRAIKLDLAGAATRPSRMTLGQSVLNRLADPNIVYLLMIAGIIGLYFEFAHPGVFLPGVAGAICLLIALASFQLIPINLAGLLLIVLGMGMLLAELFVTSYGVLGIGGVIAFVIGSLFLVDTAQSNLTVNRGIIAGTAVGFSAIVLGIGYLALRGRRGRATTGGEGMVGLVGEVRAAIAPGAPGQLLVRGEIWRAVSDQPIATGSHARITTVRGLEVTVRPEAATAAAGSSRD